MQDQADVALSKSDLSHKELYVAHSVFVRVATIFISF